VPVPDKHADEQVTEVPQGLYHQWLSAKASAKAWEDEAERLRKLLEEALGHATAGTVDGEKVITFRPGSGYAWRRIMDDYPDLAEHYTHRKVVTELDMDLFAVAHPDIAERYRIRSFREA